MKTDDEILPVFAKLLGCHGKLFSVLFQEIIYVFRSKKM